MQDCIRQSDCERGVDACMWAPLVRLVRQSTVRIPSEDSLGSSYISTARKRQEPCFIQGRRWGYVELDTWR
jgi:hypothetical protein